MNAMTVTPQNGVEHYRQSTDAADICKAIVVETAKKIGDRKYVMVEGWQAIAIAHGCAASARDVERVDGGVRAIGEVRRMADGALIAQAEGFVGEDEAVWFGGTEKAWKWGDQRGVKVWYDKTYPKRADYAIRAMAQTRAISRACRSAFAHVVVMMNADLSTTPAEEVPIGGFDDEARTAQAEDSRATFSTAQEPAAETLQSRADAFLKEVRAAPTIKALSQLCDSRIAVKLKADMDRSDPELGALVQDTISGIFDALETNAREAKPEEVFS